MAFRQDVWTHDTCLVCQSIHSNAEDKKQHESDEIHKKKVVVYDFLSRELSCLTPSDRRSLLYERYHRANASIAGLDCICELNFSWSTVPLWACTICYVAGKTVESADDHMYSSFHKRNYINEYHPDRYASMLRVQEKSSEDKKSLLEHEAIMDTLVESQGLMPPDVYLLNERDQEWAFQKLGLTDEEAKADYISEDVSDNHRITLCYICGETFITFMKEDQFRDAWFTHLATKTHQRCKFLQTLVHEDKLLECEGVPQEMELRSEIKFERHTDDGVHYGPTVGLEFLVMFSGSNESFCGLCYTTIPNAALSDHFSSEYHVERFVKRDGASKLLNSQYLSVEDIHNILVFCLGEKPVTTHKYFKSEKQLPLLLKQYTFPEKRSMVAYDLEQIELGHGIRAIWCEDCKEYVNINEDDAWNIHIFEEAHFEQGAKKALFYFDNEGLIRSNVVLDEFPRSDPPSWEEQFSVSMGILTTQDHCEFGLQFIIRDVLRKKLYCTCCFVECDEGDKQMFSYHARSLQHITRAMHSMNKKTMITLTWRFPDLNNRKPLLMDYLLHYRLDPRQQPIGISVYDPALACKLNCLAALPWRLFELAKMAPTERVKHIEASLGRDDPPKLVPLNNALQLCKIATISAEKQIIVFCCEDCSQAFASSFDKIEDTITEHLLSTSHWERAKTFDDNPFDENRRVIGKESKIKVPPYQQPNPKKKVTWKWNDKKACYEFVYVQLGIGDIRERRHFRDQKPDLFCMLCAQSFKATKLDLENHIRSFAHIFYFMHKHRPAVIPELQEQLFTPGISVVEKHKAIRRLFAKALKGAEREAARRIAIYDFEERECEYADVKSALGEDEADARMRMDDRALKVPTQQRSLTNVVDWTVGPNAGDEMSRMGKRVKRWNNGAELDKHLLELIKQEEKHAEAVAEQQRVEQQQQNGSNGTTTTTPISLELAKHQLLSVVHFDGMVQLEDGASTTVTDPQLQLPPKDPSSAKEHRNRTATPVPEKPVEPGSARSSASGLTDTNPPTPTPSSRSNRRSSPPHHPFPSSFLRRSSKSPPSSRTGRHRSRSNSRDRDRRRRRERSRSRPPADYPRHRSRSKSRSRYDQRRSSRSPTASSRRSKDSKSPPAKQPRGMNFKDEVARGKAIANHSSSGGSLLDSRSPSQNRTARPRTHSRSRSRSKTPTSDKSHKPVVYTSAAKRLHDLKMAIAQKEAQRNRERAAIIQHEDRHERERGVASTSSRSGHELVDRGEEEEMPSRMFFPPPPPITKRSADKVAEYITETASSSKNAPPPHPGFIPPPPHPVPPVPGYLNKNVGGAYDTEYLERTCPQVLRSQQPEPDFATHPTTSSANQMNSSSDSGRKSAQSGTESERDIETPDPGIEMSEMEKIKLQNQLIKRMAKEGQKKAYKKIMMNIPKELPAFKQQALMKQQVELFRAQQKPKLQKKLLRQQQQQQQEQLQKQRDRLEEERLQAISPDADEIVEVGAESEKEKEQEKRPEEVMSPQQQIQQKQNIVLEKVSKWGLVGGKFVPIDPVIATSQQPSVSPAPSTASTSSTPSIGQPIPKIGVVNPPRMVISQAQNVLTQMAASTAALTAQQILSKSPIMTMPNTSLATTTTTSAINSSSSLPVPVLLSTPVIPTSLIGGQPLPTPSLVTPLLGVPNSAAPSMGIIPPSMSIPPPRLNQPPPLVGLPPLQHPPPMIDPAEMIMRQKAALFAQDLERITTVPELIDYMWKQGYDPIPATDPPLLFNEVLNKRRGLVGANTLYQIICYGHPELETYYCGMCNHWTTVSEMFHHLRAPMHRLSYMFRFYKSFHRRAMEEQDEERRDMLLDRFVPRIWEVERSGRCTNRMRCILNEEAIRRIWPDYVNCIDHSWKIMEEEEIEFLEGTHPPPSASADLRFHTPKREEEAPVDMDTGGGPNSPSANNPLLHADQTQVRAQSAQVRAAIVAKKLELAERAGQHAVGLVSIKSEKQRPVPEEGSLGQEKNEKDKQKEKDKDRDTESSKGSTNGKRKRDRSKERKRRSRSRSRSRRRSRSREKSREKDKNKDKDRESWRSRKGRSSGHRSKSRSPTGSKDHNGNGKATTTTTGKEKEQQQPKESVPTAGETAGEKGADWNERIAEFLHKIGNTENATKVYFKGSAREEPPEGTNYWANLAMARERNESTAAASGAKSRTTMASNNLPAGPSSSLADRLANAGSALIRRGTGDDCGELEEQLRRQMKSPEGPAVTPLQQQSKQQQMRPGMEDKSEMRKAIAAMVELQQEFENNNGFLSGDVFFHTCQEFGIAPEQAVKNRLLGETAHELNVDIQAAYRALLQRRQQQQQHTSPGKIGAVHAAQQQPCSSGQAMQQQSPMMNLQSMGVDASKLRGLDPRALQSILSKAGQSSSTAGGHPLAPSSSLPRRLEAHDLALDESLAPGNYVYPSYEEEGPPNQKRQAPGDIDQNISRLTYAFSRQQQNVAQQQQNARGGGAEVTLAVSASRGGGPPPGHRAVPPSAGGQQHIGMMLGRNQQQMGRPHPPLATGGPPRHPLDPRSAMNPQQAQQPVPPDPRGAAGGRGGGGRGAAPPDPSRPPQMVQGHFSEADTREQPMDLDFTDDMDVWWRGRGPPPPAGGGAGGPPLPQRQPPAGSSPSMRGAPEVPPAPNQQHVRPSPPPPTGPAAAANMPNRHHPPAGWPSGWPRPTGPAGMPVRQPSPSQQRAAAQHPPPPHQMQGGQAGGGAGPSGQQPQQRASVNPDLRRLAMPPEAPVSGGAEGADSLFAQGAEHEEVPWWQRNFLLQQPTLVNAWNAVFPTVIVNIFGIVIFLRMGWIVVSQGTAGLFQAIVVLALCTLFSSVTVLSAIGICERCQIRSGGIYFLVSHVLGKQIGGAVGLIYTFGQACATALVALGFGESMAKLAGVFNPVAIKTLSIMVLLILNAMNFAGLRFIIRLQLLLMCFLGLAIGDFLLGAVLFTPQDPEAGIGELSMERLSANWYSQYGPNNCTPPGAPPTEFESGGSEEHSIQLGQESFFSVFGILFANFIGVLAGVNMSGNLVDPLRNIAEGELTALGASFGLCLLIMLILGASVDRYALLCDVMISERLSLTKLLFLGGLYIACLSAILSSTLGTSRVVQGIAAEGLVPRMSRLLQEESPHKDPLKATVLVTGVAVLLVLLGNLNQMATLSSMPFLLTYAFVNYAYVSLAMSDDLDSLSRECAAGDGPPTNYGSVQDGLATAAAQTSSVAQQRSLNALFSSTADDDENGGGARGHGAGSWGSKPWYQRCINRYVSFGAAIVHLLVLLFINSWYALLHLVAFVGLYLYLGKTCPAVSDQGVSHFSIVHMVRVAMAGMDSFTPFGPSSTSSGPSVIPPAPPGPLVQPGDLQPTRLNADNPDYAGRKQYHHAEGLR